MSPARRWSALICGALFTASCLLLASPASDVVTSAARQRTAPLAAAEAQPAQPALHAELAAAMKRLHEVDAQLEALKATLSAGALPPPPAPVAETEPVVPAPAPAVVPPLATPGVSPAPPTLPAAAAAEQASRWPHCSDGSRATTATVVTSMVILPDGRSKHSTATYEAWLSLTLASVTGPLALFLGNYPGGEARIRELRGDRPLHIVSVGSTWELPRAAELRAEYEGRQHSIDHYRDIHSPELYAIWNGKIDMLANVSGDNPFCSKYFLWADGGGFRGRTFPGWPASERVEDAFSQRPDTMIFSLFGEPDGWSSFVALAEEKKSYADIAADGRWNGDSNAFLMHHVLQGGFLGGSAAAIEAYSTVYHRHLLQQTAAGRYIGVDQINFSILFAASLHEGAGKGRISSIRAAATCGDIWFYYIAFFASEQDRGCNLLTTDILPPWPAPPWSAELARWAVD